MVIELKAKVAMKAIETIAMDMVTTSNPDKQAFCLKLLKEIRDYAGSKVPEEGKGELEVEAKKDSTIPDVPVDDDLGSLLSEDKDTEKVVKY